MTFLFEANHDHRQDETDHQDEVREKNRDSKRDRDSKRNRDSKKNRKKVQLFDLQKDEQKT